MTDERLTDEVVSRVEKGLGDEPGPQEWTHEISPDQTLRQIISSNSAVAVADVLINLSVFTRQKDEKILLHIAGYEYETEWFELNRDPEELEISCPVWNFESNYKGEKT